MYRASTPKQTWIFKNDPDEYSELKVTYSQRDEIILTKTKSDMTFTTKTVNGIVLYYGSYRLTQEETNLFDDKFDVEIQIRCLTNDGNSVPSPIKRVPVKRVLDDTVME